MESYDNKKDFNEKFIVCRVIEYKSNNITFLDLMRVV